MRSAVVALLTFAAVVSAASISHTFVYSPTSLKLDQQDGHTIVDFAGLPHIDRLGAPDLPVAPAQLLIPADAELTGFEIVDFREELIPGSYLIRPVQYPQAYTTNPLSFPFVQPNQSYYGSTFPPSPAELTSPGTKSGYQLVGFRVYPVRYNGATRQLSVVTQLTVKLTYKTGRRHVARRSELQIALHGSALSGLVLNPQDIDRFAPPRKTGERQSAFLPAGTYEHVILAADIYKDSLTKLRDWRTRQGWRSIIVPIESVCAVYPGVDTAERMRNFLKDAETTWSTVFCFIARKDWPANQFRRGYAYVSGYPVENLPTDMYFSCLDGSWNADGDNTWGEPNDSVDCLADIHVGMITIDSWAELSKYLAKIFRYEFSPDTGWFTKALLGNDVTFSNNFNDSIANATPTPPWFDLKMYASGGMVTPSVQRYVDSLQSGYPLTAIIAHGNIDLYGMGGNVTSPIMNALTNVNKLSMITAVCCHTGEWDQVGNTNGDCIAENMAFHAPNGFIGVMMNARYGWVSVAEYFNYSISYGLLGYRTARRVTQGQALSYGKDYWHPLVAVTTDTSKFRYEAYERNLFGEPAVPIWTKRAFVASVTRPGAINIGSNIPVPITVTDNSDAPVESAMVCLVKGTETFARGFTDASGQVTLLVSPLTPGMMSLTVTGANNLPVLDSIVVMAAGKFVSYLRHSVNDSTGGNGDGIINPGESFRLPMWVKNYGTQTAQSVNGRLITHAAGVMITDSIKGFGSIPGGDSSRNAQGFAMTVATGLPNNYPIPCSLVCRDNLDSIWVSYVTLRVGAPSISFVDKTVRDENSSRPNGKLDPGETADLEVTLRNGGLGNAYNVRAILRSGDARLTITDSMAAYGTVRRDSLSTNTGDRFTLAASASIPPETPIACTLDVYADAGYTERLVFTIVVGEIRTVDPMPDGPRQPALYWAYDEVDTGYDECPVYNWMEIRNLGTRLTLSDDQTVVINIPSAFGAFRFYGQNYTQLSICGNGWVGLGSTTVSAYSNTSLPSTTLPPAFLANWDDLYPPTGGGVWWYHDTTNHCLIVEWDSVAYYSARTTFESFQIIFYDATRAARDGNCEVIFQYRTANQPGSSATVGMQDPSRTIFIQQLYDGSYTRGASTWIPGHAVKFTSDDPRTGLFDNPAIHSLYTGQLVAVPSVFRSTTSINWQVKREGPVELAVFDASGRNLCSLVRGRVTPGTYISKWNGTDDNGRPLGYGVYFIRLKSEDGTVKTKTILAR